MVSSEFERTFVASSYAHVRGRGGGNNDILVKVDSEGKGDLL